MLLGSFEPMYDEMEDEDDEYVLAFLLHDPTITYQ